ncbi:hypothetical protein GCM10011487_57030 [Steroidobacter agaridevorans]|uniref:Carrier domain-containing protein n=1 Tax=Steroidobacter agaridevorans TaxID=2695856 RepID=A0A829YLI7_9GAMM|nr:non-ribosomal peptide synthetase [Steroidobacter agaridevorans]GFE83703.1 hypothetical protein GCM10011487_57030 [Steroidobacter agaridevorans]
MADVPSNRMRFDGNSAQNNDRLEASGHVAETTPSPLEMGPGPEAITRHNGHLGNVELDIIERAVPGGSSNIQDIYPLSSLQEGMLFHGLLNRQNDTYVLSTLLEFQSSAQGKELVIALQTVVDRHDSLRTAILWEGLRKPIQVVYRQATLQVGHLDPDENEDLAEQFRELVKPKNHALDMKRAPVMTLEITPRAYRGKWYALLRVHHGVCDHQSLSMVITELMACMRETGHSLPLPVAYRSYIERNQRAIQSTESKDFFRRKLQDVREPTAPFGILDVHGDGRQLVEGRLEFEPAFSQRVRAQAKRHGVSAARLIHAAWALVVARTSGRDDVVFGTVLLATDQRGVKAPRVLGLAVNTLPLRLQLSALTAAQLLAHTDLELRLLSEHEHCPLMWAQQCSGVAGTSALFTSILNYRRASRLSQTPSTAGVRVIERGEAWTNYPITMIVDDHGNGFSLTAQTDRRIDPNRLTTYLEAAVSSLTDALEHRSSATALLLPILPENERKQLTDLFNATQAPYPKEHLLHQLFERQVERTPHAVAVVSADQYLTYRQLNARANQLACYLRRQGAKPDRFVGLCVDRGIDMIVGVLGILKSGAAYVPLDPNYPRDRLEYILKDAAPVTVLTQQRTRERLPETSHIVILDTQWADMGEYAATNLTPDGLNANCLAYVIYTSGSTGQPKGVAIEHRSAVNMVCWAQSTLSLDVFDETLQSTSLNFDLSVYECFVPLAVGGSLRIVPNAIALVDERPGVTLINTVPSAIKAIMNSGGIPTTTRVVNLAGEALTEDVVDSIFESSSVHCVSNLYGPSETTTYSTYVVMPREEGFNASVGRPVSNTQVHILDRNLQMVPLGVIGEIYIGGDGVARGYLHRPDLTADRFIADPFGPHTQARIYRTGDLGRWRADGTIEYLGRDDQQVKIRGFRIELGEIETKLVRHPHVKEAVVIAREDARGDKRLVAYVVPTQTSSIPMAEELGAALRHVFPEYMVPSAFMVLDRIPLSPNGKLDRQALPAPNWDAYISHDYEVPVGEVEKLLARIWEDLLGLKPVGRNHNFFELGGHSLLIVQLMDRLRQAGLSTDLRRVFESQTLKDLAEILASGVSEQSDVPPNRIPPGCTMITPDMLTLIELEQEHIDRIVHTVPGGAINIQDIYPLVPLQEGILFHHLMSAPGRDAYVLPFVFSVSSSERLCELKTALQRVIDRHDVLRTAVLWEELRQPVQIVYREATLHVDEIVLNAMNSPRDCIEELLRQERQTVDLRCAPLMRLWVATDEAKGQSYALLQLHHMIFDHTTLEVLTAEIVAHLEGRAHNLIPSVPYRDHVARVIRHVRLRDAEAFFRQKLGEVHEPTAPFGLIDVHGDGVEVNEAQERLTDQLAQSVRRQARRHGVSSATLFHAGWSLVIAHCSGRSDVVFGTLLLGRLQAGSDSSALGVFINTLPLRIQVECLSAKELVENTQQELVDLLSHEQASLAVAQKCSGVGGSRPLFSALLNYRHSSSTIESQWARADGIQLLGFKERTNYPITLSVDDMADGFTLTAQTDQRIAPQRIIGYLRMAMQSLVSALQASEPVLALSLPILPDAERRELASNFDAASTGTSDKLVHELFEAQVQRTPNAVAVVYEGRSLTYADLNRGSNQVAAYLGSRGVSSDDVIGICVNRTLDMVVGLLGILKCGGAYLPLDPSYPAERLNYMLADAAPKIVLTQKELVAALPETPSEVVLLDDPGNPIGTFGDESPSTTRKTTADGLVYVIYTSGSTGRPKGVAMSHRAMVSLIDWHRAHSRLSQRHRVLQYAPLSFDVAFQEIFSTLCAGSTLVLLDEWIRKDARALMEFIDSEYIDRLFIPPLMLQGLAECFSRTGAVATSLKDVIAAGEQLRVTPEVVELFTSLEDCWLHNHYGPTETHVVTALSLGGPPREWPSTPSIGRPVSNAKIYILDRHRQLAPLGAVGEIYIGGASLARGYLNRAEMTADRFLPPSTVAESQTRLYRTGDLGRWQSDGSIEYLGRNDDQVKIRGYRIELGEIEAHLSRHLKIKEVAVVAREDVPGEKRLVAYVCRRNSVDLSVEDLREYLKELLPQYMVPSAFVFLAVFPLTPSGKLDRRALPAPESDAYATEEYEAPEGAAEEAIAGIWREVLQVDRIGRRDNFFELGGHSLLAVKALFRLNEAFDASLRVTDIYMHPSVQQLGLRVAGGNGRDDLIDLAKEAALDDQIVPTHPYDGVPAAAVLVTGATGFVGRFLLAQLLRDTGATVYCLVRAHSVQQASARLRSTLMKWDLWRDQFEGKILAIPGDLRLPRLGVDASTYEILSREIDSIYHCGTSMNHLETYSMAKPANVDSAIELLRLATNKKTKLVNYISTMSVFQSSPGDTRVVDEHSPIERETHRQSNGYAASKWVGEKIFMVANERGIPCNIFRVGFVWADTEQGRYDDLQRGYRVLKSSLLSGYGISNFRYHAPPTPVDYTTRAVVFLATRHVEGGGIFHISSTRELIEGFFERCNDILGTSLELVPYFVWVRVMERLHRGGQTLPIVPLIEATFSMDERSFYEYERRIQSHNVAFSCERTHQELGRAGIEAPVLDDELLKKCIRSILLRDSDFQEASHGANVDRPGGDRLKLALLTQA